MVEEKKKMQLKILEKGFKVELPEEPGVIYEIISKSSKQAVLRNIKSNCIRTFGLRKQVYFLVISPHNNT